LLLQGDEDKIVPPNQAELMHEALLAKGLPCALKMYEGEQHGFRKAENIEDALNSELYFYSKVFGFTCAGDDVVPFAIDNLDEADISEIDADKDGVLTKEAFKAAKATKAKGK